MNIVNSKTAARVLNKLLLVAAISISTLSFAYANEAADKQMRNDVESQVVERIEVFGQKPIKEYRKAVREAEIAFYRAYNAKVDDKQYKIICKSESPTGSRLAEKKCYPNIVLTRFSRETRLRGHRGGLSQRNRLLAEEMQKANKEVSDYMAKVVFENPALANKFIELKQKRQALYARLSDN